MGFLIREGKAYKETTKQSNAGCHFQKYELLLFVIAMNMF